MKLEVQPGYVAALFFIVFDVLILALMDVVLAHLVCRIYYRNIQLGSPIAVKSADVPGITTYLLGRIASFTNIVALLLKISFIILVFFVNVKIDNTRIRRFFPETRHASFDLDPSDKAWANVVRRVTRERGLLSTCLAQDPPASQSLVYFRPAYNLDGVIPDFETNDTQPFYPVEPRSFYCLNASVVNPVALVNVTGCSPFLADSCFDSSGSTLDVDTSAQSTVSLAVTRDTVEDISNDYVIDIENYNDSGLRTAFSEYDNPVMYCKRVCPNTKKLPCCTTERLENCAVPTRPCILTARIGSDTLVERWDIRSRDGLFLKMTRDFPGPVFRGEWDFGSTILGQFLLYSAAPQMDWRTLSNAVLTESLIYRKGPINYDRVELRKGTDIPTYAIVLGATALILAIIGRILVHFTIGRDDRPRFNSIDGLSSIVREENTPSGRSYESGATAVVGLSTRGIQAVHFGPLHHHNDSVARQASKVV